MQPQGSGAQLPQGGIVVGGQGSGQAILTQTQRQLPIYRTSKETAMHLAMSGSAHATQGVWSSTA